MGQGRRVDWIDPKPDVGAEDSLASCLGFLCLGSLGFYCVFLVSG